MPVPQAPNNMSEFKEKASEFVAKAKAQGKSNTAIANTLQFMYKMTQDNIADRQSQEMTPFQKASIELARDKAEKEGIKTQIISDKYGNLTLINTQTGEVIKDYSASGDEGVLSGVESEGNYPDETDETGGFTEGGDLDLDQLFNTTSSQQQTPVFGSEVLERIGQIDNPVQTDPVTGQPISDLNLEGLDLGNVFGQKPHRPNLLSPSYLRPVFHQLILRYLFETVEY